MAKKIAFEKQLLAKVCVECAPRLKIRLESLLNIQQYKFNDLKVLSKGVDRQKVQAMRPTSTGTRVSSEHTQNVQQYSARVSSLDEE